MIDTVSVILPYFNRVDALESAAKSVLAQTYRSLILYMVNDGSTDGSRDVARSIDDVRIVHLDAIKNGGACRARNLGLAAVDTALVAFHDSDDEWLPDKLERQVKQLRSLQRGGVPVSVLGCGWRYHASKSPTRTFTPGPFTRAEMLKGVVGTGTPMLLIDRSVAAADPSFDVTFPSLEERDFVLSLMANGSLLSVVPEILAVVTRGRDDHVANPRKAALGWERCLTKYAPELSTDDALCSWYHFRAAREFLIAGQRSRAREHLREALKFMPVKRFIHLVAASAAGGKGLAVAQRLVPCG